MYFLDERIPDLDAPHGSRALITHVHWHKTCSLHGSSTVKKRAVVHRSVERGFFFLKDISPHSLTH